MEKNNALLAMLAQYENKAIKKTSNTEFDLKNYFYPGLDAKENSKTFKVRILPTMDGTSPFVPVMGHKTRPNGETKDKTFICPKETQGITNTDCPFCETKVALYATKTVADKELAKKYMPRLAYIVKVIDRSKEDEGPKFWKFNDDFRKEGVLDKIYGVINALQKDITDVDNGRDLFITVARNQTNVPVVQSITHLDPSPLHTDKTIAEEWCANDKTWNRVYGVKSYEYLEIVVKGGVPRFDKDLNKWVDKQPITTQEEPNKLDAELVSGLTAHKEKEEIKLETKKVKTEKLVVKEEIKEPQEEEDNDDLPF